jgi:ArsR family transcriptional regulator
MPTISKHLQLLREANVIKMQKKANKIYIEPNIETIRELGGCFTKLVENFETDRELFFDDIVLK